MKYYEFDCGCSFPIIQEFGKNKFPKLQFKYPEDFKREECPAVWQLCEKGLTLGIFQLESNLGKHYCKELKPTCINHLAALGAILRPGVLNSKDENGKSITQKYCDRKNFKEPVTYSIAALEPILKDTYGLMIFQESTIRIGIEIGGMSASEADFYLRKGIGQKKADILFAAEEKFINGSIKLNKVTKEEAIKIFDNIKASARYQFNLSHSQEYSIRSFYDLYLKAHFPLHFYTAKLKSPRSGVEQVDLNNLIYEAKLFDIQTKLPDLRHCQPNFYNDGKSIYFGLTNIKGFGDAAFIKLNQVYLNNKKELVGNFFDFAINSARHLTPSMVLLLIESGAVDYFNLPREQMMEEYRLITDLTDTELDRLFKIYDAEKAGIEFS